MSKILIVDDQPEIRELVSVTLEMDPYRILTAENGGTRMARVDQLEPHNVFAHLAAPLIQREVSRNTRLEFQNIKDLLEGD